MLVPIAALIQSKTDLYNKKSQKFVNFIYGSCNCYIFFFLKNQSTARKKFSLQN